VPLASICSQARLAQDHSIGKFPKLFKQGRVTFRPRPVTVTFESTSEPSSSLRPQNILYRNKDCVDRICWRLHCRRSELSLGLHHRYRDRVITAPLLSAHVRVAGDGLRARPAGNARCPDFYYGCLALLDILCNSALVASR
jgi:hypothetical protein